MTTDENAIREDLKVGNQFELTESAAFREMEMAGAKPTSVLSITTRMVSDVVGTPGKQVFAALEPASE